METQEMNVREPLTTQERKLVRKALKYAASELKYQAKDNKQLADYNCVQRFILGDLCRAIARWLTTETKKMKRRASQYAELVDRFS